MSKLSAANYGIGVSNVFDLLQDENEEIEASKQKPGVRVPQKRPQENKKVEGRPEGGQGRGAGGIQRGRGESRGRGRRFLPGEGAPENLGEKQTERYHDRGDRRGREGLPIRPGKRVYDRKSGTGRGKEISKGGAGRGNWGSTSDEITEGEQVSEEGAPEAPKEGEEKVEEVKEEEPAPEPEEQVKTLAEYLEEKKNKSLGLSLPAPRTAGEGEDPNKWKDYVPMKKEGAVAEEKKEVKTEKKEKKESKAEAEVDPSSLLNFKIPRSRPEGRGRRGGDRENRPRNQGYRGGGGRGRGSEARGGSSIKVDDPSQFPSLAGKA